MIHIKSYFLGLAFCLVTGVTVQNCSAMTAEVTQSEQGWLSVLWKFFDIVVQNAHEEASYMAGRSPAEEPKKGKTSKNGSKKKSEQKPKER